MQNYYQEKYVESKKLNNQGNMEIIFKDKSRYLGDFANNMIQGVGIFYIQSIGRYDGDFFNNKFIEGKLTFNEKIVYKGEFNENETFGKGTLVFLKKNRNIQIEFDGAVIQKVTIEENDRKNILSFKNKINSFIYEDGWELFIDDNYKKIILQNRYSGNLFTETRTIVNLEKNIFLEEHYVQGKKSGKQYELNLSLIPYYKEWEEKESPFMVPKHFMQSVNGNQFNGTLSFKNGETTIEGKTYIFEGPVEGPYKNGKGILYFKDGCKKNVEYIQDKICFEGLDKVFEFVSNFRCFEHPELKVGNNLEMVKFMDKVSSFKGFIKNGSTDDKAEIIFTNGEKYIGKLLNFKKQGKGILIKKDCTINGNFHNDDMTYGIADFKSGAKYEGQFFDFDMSGKGTMKFGNNFRFIGSFVNGVIGKQGGFLVGPDGVEKEVYYVHIWEFGFGVFVVKKTEELFVLDCMRQTVHDAGLITVLEESGINIRESLREIQGFN